MSPSSLMGGEVILVLHSVADLVQALLAEREARLLAVRLRCVWSFRRRAPGTKIVPSSRSSS
jgi:hypothetical protein